MKENKGYIPKNKNGNVRCNESNIGLYSRFINQAKRNSVKNTPNIEYNKLTSSEQAEWAAAMVKWNKETEKETESFTPAISPSKFYEVKADRIQFTKLHEIVLDTLEEMYNQQSIDNVYNWMNGRNGENYEDMGRIYTNPSQIAKYIWGVAHPEYVKKVADVIYDLSHEIVLLGRREKQKEKDIYVVKQVTLIITCGTTCITTKNDQIKERYSYIQLHPVFFEKISKFYIPRRNNLISMLRDFYYNDRKKTGYKKKYMLPPNEPRYLAQYLYEFAVQKNYNITLDEETIAHELNIKEFNQRRISRGRNKITNSLDALKYAGMVKDWNNCLGKKGQQQYSVELIPEYFGRSEDKNNNKVES